MTKALKQMTKTAHHEAGHAIMMLIYGQSFNFVEVFKEEHLREPWDPNILLDGRVNHEEFYGIGPEQKVLIALAGVAAEHILTGRIPNTLYEMSGGAVDDYQGALRLAKQAHSGEGYAFIGKTMADDLSDVYLSYMRRRARLILATHWIPVTQLASALLERGRVSFDEATELMPASLKNGIRTPDELEQRNSSMGIDVEHERRLAIARKRRDLFFTRTEQGELNAPHNQTERTQPNEDKTK